MADSDQDRLKDEIEGLRRALEAESHASIEVQRELERIHAEFEEFVSTAAHNLRESLRDITAYSQLLEETRAGRLDAASAQSLRRIQAGAGNMGTLLTAMVDYWAAYAANQYSSPADMETVFRRAQLAAETLIAEKHAIVSHDPLPAVAANSEVLARVLQHLIRNAIEYCDDPTPRVHLSCNRVDTDWVFSVHDNGVGIEPAFRERIFGAFKRLHGKEHPGNGLGLAFCRKAIEQLGGRIWVEANPVAGSTFHFSLPAGSRTQ